MISLGQYKAYCDTFGIIPLIKASPNRKVTVIGGTQNACGIVSIQIPFKYIKILVDLQLLVLNCTMRTLFCLLDLVKNALDISVTNKFLINYGRLLQLKMTNYFSVYNWSPKCMDFVLYA